MSPLEFLNAVPLSFKRAAGIVTVCLALAGLVMAGGKGTLTFPFVFPGGAAMFFVIAVFSSLWILCLGFVNADARRRGMPPWIWTLIAAFIPNLLGFLLYFACRRPIAVPCPHCGQANAPDQRFCSWCGHAASGPLASEGKLA